MGKRTCSVPDCVKDSNARGYCKAHYSRWLRHGDPLGGGPPRPWTLNRPRSSVLDRFNAKIERAESGCWLWLGHIDNRGYGDLKVDGRQVRAHRLSYETFVGPIPDGLQIDHLCRNRACVNPTHLEPVTSAENTRRGRDAHGTWGRGLSALRNPQMECKRGHPLNEENTYIIPSTGSRSCKECTRQRGRDYKARKKQLA